MSYRVPNVYATFESGNTQVNAIGNTRVLALIGTGQTSYLKKNVAITKASNSAVDKLPDNNITQILSISSQPVGQGYISAENKNYSINKYTLLNKEYISWPILTDDNSKPKITNPIVIHGDNGLLNHLTIELSNDSKTWPLISDCDYTITITNVDPVTGTYEIYDETNEKLVGEYCVNDNFASDIIYGINFKLKSTVVYETDLQGNKTIISNIGNTIKFSTIAGKTQIEPIIDKITGLKNKNLNLEMNSGLTYYTNSTQNLVINYNIKSLTDLNSVKYNLKLFNAAGVQQVFSDVVDSISFGVEGTINGLSVTLSNITTDTSSNPIIDASQVFIGTVDMENLKQYDEFVISINLHIKSTVDKTMYNLLMEIGDFANTNTVNNVTKLLVYQSLSAEVLKNKNEIFGDLITNMKVINAANIVKGNYKLRIKDLDSQTFEIYDLNKNKLVPTMTLSLQTSTKFREAIPGVYFEIPTLSNIKGLFQPFDVTNTLDINASEIYINTIPGVTNDLVPDEGSIYYVTYKCEKTEEDKGPRVFYDFEDVVNEYGNYNITSNGWITNSLTLGAQIAFENGARPIVCVQANSFNDDDINKAMDTLINPLPGNINVSAVVPLSTSRAVLKHLENHINYLSLPENSIYRMGYFAALKDEPVSKLLTILDTIAGKTSGSVQITESLNNERMVYIVPGGGYKNIIEPLTNTSVNRLVNGAYLAAAVAAIAMAQDPAEPLTKKTISGFTSLNKYYNSGEMNELASNGCLVLEQLGTDIFIRHGITTCTSTVNSNEITVVQIKDYTILIVKNELGKTYIGKKQTGTIVADVEYTVKSILEQLIAQKIILSYTNLSVKRDKTNPTQINVKFQIEAVYPLNYIDIVFGFTTYNG